MLSITAGIVLGSLGIVALILVLFFFHRVQIFSGLGEGLHEFQEEMQRVGGSVKRGQKQTSSRKTPVRFAHPINMSSARPFASAAPMAGLHLRPGETKPTSEEQTPSHACSVDNIDVEENDCIRFPMNT